MSGSWTHMLLGSIWSFLIVGLLTAGVLKGFLWWRRRRSDSIEAFDDPNVFALLVSTGLLPPLWALSALVHHLEGEHGFIEETCPPLGFFAGAEVAFAVGASALLAWYAVWKPAVEIVRDLSDSASRSHRLENSDPVSRRLTRLCEEHPRLADLADRVVAVTGSGHACATRGIVRPRIEVRCEAIEEWEEAELIGALLHEAAHLRNRDPLLQTTVFLARHWNPFGFLLDAERRAWRYARELNCDATAVSEGADPLSLASALVAAARPTSPCRHPHSVALEGCDIGPIETRVQILMGYAEEPPNASRDVTHDGRGLLALLSSAALLLPHALDAWPMPLHLLSLWWDVI